MFQADRLTIGKGVDERYAEGAFDQAKRFFALPEEKKMEVFTGLVPNEYIGYHPMKCYNRNGWKHQGTSPTSPFKKIWKADIFARFE
jgi:isopenicillin N synthase-like dioxygenase